MLTMIAGITPQSIRAELDRIVASEGFVRARRMQRFLQFVVEETLAGRADQLGEYSIAVTVFDRPHDFDPAFDPIVRNDARRLRVKLLEYYRVLEASADRIVIEIPKGGYIPVFRHDASMPGCPRLAVLPFQVLSLRPECALHAQALRLSLTSAFTNVDGIEAVACDYSSDRPLRQVVTELRLRHAIRGSLFEAGDHSYFPAQNSVSLKIRVPKRAQTRKRPPKESFRGRWPR